MPNILYDHVGHTIQIDEAAQPRAFNKHAGLSFTAIPALTAPECAGGLIEAGYDVRKFELYDTWFDENSTVTLVQAGVYQGVDEIEEYVKVLFPVSPYISVHGALHVEQSFVSFNEEKRSCAFSNMRHSRFQMSEMGGNELFETAWFTTVEWRFDDQKIARIDFFRTLPSLLRESCGPPPTAQPRATEGAAVTLCTDPARPRLRSYSCPGGRQPPHDVPDDACRRRIRLPGDA